MKTWTVREPHTTSVSTVKGSSFHRSLGSKVPSGSHNTIRSPVASASPRRMAAP